ncbi:MAG: hypothetical protein ACXV3U_06435 [Halobacteriota archaeon]
MIFKPALVDGFTVSVLFKLDGDAKAVLDVDADVDAPPAIANTPITSRKTALIMAIVLLNTISDAESRR